jgi:putative DNA primase/helicase
MTEAKDFNDMHQEQGPEAVREKIETAEPVQDAEAIARLAVLPLLEYDRIREAEANRMGVRASTLDKTVDAARKIRTEEIGIAPLLQDIDAWPTPVNGVALLDEIYTTIRTFIICPEETARAATLWIAFTWFIDRVQVAPLAIITAPEKRCGKSQLLDVLGRLSRRPLVASNISPAAIFRVIEAYSPTLLIDEADTFLRDNQEAWGIINSGHKREGAYVLRTVGDDHEPKLFGTWGAKAISGIGTQAETLMDRAVLLQLRRKLATEKVERLRHADRHLFKNLAAKLARYALDAGDAIEAARPALPHELNDRAQDNWEPLMAIADHAGGDWPKLARTAALKVSGGDQDSISTSAELLADIQEIFEAKTFDRITTKDLLDALNADDLKPWATYNRGHAMSARQLAKKLEAYELKPHSLNMGGAARPKGYYRKSFDEVFERYLSCSGTPGNAATPLLSQEMSVISGLIPVADKCTVAQAAATNFEEVADITLRSGNENSSATDKPLKRVNGSGVADKTGEEAKIVVTL